MCSNLTIKSYHFRRSFERSLPVLVLKEGNATAAASIARWVSAASNSGAVPINLPDDGSARLIFSPLEIQNKPTKDLESVP
jgi:hypothetical protein